MGEKETRPMRIVPSAESRIGYLFWLSRPRYWHYLGSPVLLGLIYAADSVGELLSIPSLAFALYFLIPGNVFLYGVNDAFDVDTDEHNPKKASEGKEMMFQEDTSVVGAIVLSGVLAVGFLGITDSETVLLLVATWLLLSVEYSAPPLRLKSIPLVDSLSNGLYVIPGIAAYVSLAGEFPPLTAIVAFWMWTMGYHTFAAIPDIEPDRKANVRTLATVLGERWSLAYCGVLWLGASIVFTAYHPIAGAVFLVYPLIDAFVVWKDVDVERAYWWFPTINAVVGVPLMAPGLWLLLN